MAYLLIEVPESYIEDTCPEIFAESVWKPSGINNIYIRVDPERPEMKAMRHVHIAHRKHIAAPNKQVSWNDDQSRHDRHLFDDGFRGIEHAKAVARIALKLPDDFFLENQPKLFLKIVQLLEDSITNNKIMDIPDFVFSINNVV